MSRCDECQRDFASSHLLAGHNRRMHCDWNTIRTDARRKLRLLEERGHRCEVCDKTEWMGQPIPLEIDHIDGNPENTAYENFRLICPNCHAQTPTYRGRNMGKVQNSKRAATLKKYYGRYR